MRVARVIGVMATMAFAGCGHSRHVANPGPSALPALEVDSSGVPFAPAPEGLLRQEGIPAIQSKLQARGLLGGPHQRGRLDTPTREALRRFQSAVDLPATGLPNYRTVEALGLKADEIFLARGART